MNPETKQCQNCKKDFVIEPADLDFYKKIDVPPPTWCWQCRAMRRMSFRNMRYLYARTCDATGKKIFTLMPPEAPVPIYDREYWGSDAWDPMSYGKEYDFSRPFFEQFKDLFHAVPWAPMWNSEKVNSDYAVVSFAKNCYLCFDTGYVEDAAYAVSLHGSKECIDVINCEDCELCYYCINTNKSYKTFFSRNCTSCNEVWFSQDCVGCTNCVGCTGLRNKSYYIFNQPYTKEEYAKKIKEMQLDCFSGVEKVRREAESVWKKYPVKYQHSVQANRCQGDYIYDSAEIRNCFFVGNSQNCAHSQSIIYGPIKDCVDVTSTGINTELDYETIDAGDALFRVFFAVDVGVLNECQYIINSRQSSNLFGCVGMRSKEYCILNRQYSKEEYKALVPKIIEHMNAMPYVDAKGRTYRYGEFFPPEISMFGYNETQGQEYFPLSRKEAEERGYKWKVPEKRNYSVTKNSETLSDSIVGVSDSILEEIIQCMHNEKNGHTSFCEENCTTAFRLTPQEVEFYKKLNLPLPRLCFNCRHWDRVAWRNWPKLYARQCMCDNKVYKNETKHNHHPEGKCPNTFETSYAPDRPEIVYCEACYNSEVV